MRRLAAGRPPRVQVAHGWPAAATAWRRRILLVCALCLVLLISVATGLDANTLEVKLTVFGKLGFDQPREGAGEEKYKRGEAQKWILLPILRSMLDNAHHADDSEGDNIEVAPPPMEKLDVGSSSIGAGVVWVDEDTRKTQSNFTRTVFSYTFENFPHAVIAHDRLKNDYESPTKAFVTALMRSLDLADMYPHEAMEFIADDGRPDADHDLTAFLNLMISATDDKGTVTKTILPEDQRTAFTVHKCLTCSGGTNLPQTEGLKLVGCTSTMGDGDTCVIECDKGYLSTNAEMETGLRECRAGSSVLSFKKCSTITESAACLSSLDSPVSKTPCCWYEDGREHGGGKKYCLTRGSELINAWSGSITCTAEKVGILQDKLPTCRKKCVILDEEWFYKQGCDTCLEGDEPCPGCQVTCTGTRPYPFRHQSEGDFICKSQNLPICLPENPEDGKGCSLQKLRDSISGVNENRPIIKLGDEDFIQIGKMIDSECPTGQTWDSETVGEQGIVCKTKKRELGEQCNHNQRDNKGGCFEKLDEVGKVCCWKGDAEEDAGHKCKSTSEIAPRDKLTCGSQSFVYWHVPTCVKVCTGYTKEEFKDTTWKTYMVLQYLDVKEDGQEGCKKCIPGKTCDSCKFTCKSDFSHIGGPMTGPATCSTEGKFRLPICAKKELLKCPQPTSNVKDYFDPWASFTTGQCYGSPNTDCQVKCAPGFGDGAVLAVKCEVLVSEPTSSGASTMCHQRKDFDICKNSYDKGTGTSCCVFRDVYKNPQITCKREFDETMESLPEFEGCSLFCNLDNQCDKEECSKCAYCIHMISNTNLDITKATPLGVCAPSRGKPKWTEFPVCKAKCKPQHDAGFKYENCDCAVEEHLVKPGSFHFFRREVTRTTVLKVDMDFTILVGIPDTNARVPFRSSPDSAYPLAGWVLKDLVKHRDQKCSCKVSCGKGNKHWKPRCLLDFNTNEAEWVYEEGVPKCP